MKLNGASVFFFSCVTLRRRDSHTNGHEWDVMSQLKSTIFCQHNWLGHILFCVYSNMLQVCDLLLQNSFQSVWALWSLGHYGGHVTPTCSIHPALMCVHAGGQYGHVGLIHSQTTSGQLCSHTSLDSTWTMWLKCSSIIYQIFFYKNLIFCPWRRKKMTKASIRRYRITRYIQPIVFWDGQSVFRGCCHPRPLPVLTNDLTCTLSFIFPMKRIHLGVKQANKQTKETKDLSLIEAFTL